MGKWLEVNGESIYGTQPTLFGAEAGSFCTTEKDEDGKPKFIPHGTGDRPPRTTRSTSTSSNGPQAAPSTSTRCRERSQTPTCWPTQATSPLKSTRTGIASTFSSRQRRSTRLPPFSSSIHRSKTQTLVRKGAATPHPWFQSVHSINIHPFFFEAPWQPYPPPGVSFLAANPFSAMRSEPFLVGSSVFRRQRQVRPSSKRFTTGAGTA